MKNHVLTQADTYKLLKWLDTPEQRALALKNEDAETVTAAAKALGLRLSPLNIVKARKTLGIEKKRRVTGGKASADFQALTDLVATQEGKINTLKHNVQSLLDRVTNLEQRPRH